MVDFRNTVIGVVALNALKLQGQQNAILSEIWMDAFIQDFIIDLQKEQLRFGKLGNGGEFPLGGPAYIDSVRRIRGAQQKPTDKVNLLNTGAFYDTIDIQIGTSFFTLIANTTIYGDDFKSIYGFDILGFNDENLQKLIDFVRPIFIEKTLIRLLAGI